MISSMTGFGKVSKEISNKSISLEIRSLNSRFLDLNLRLPPAYKDKEIELRSRMSRRLMRGKVDITMNLEYTGSIPTQKINKSLFKAYYNEFKEIQSDLEDNQGSLMELVMRVPNIIMPAEELIDESEMNEVYHMLEETLDKVIDFRLQEGRELEKDLRLRIILIREGLEKVEVLDPQRIEIIRKKIKDQLSAWLKDENVDENRLEQEFIYYLEKLDITEEKVRLKSHCDYFVQVLDGNENEAKGKKLTFISQEIGREINTIGSKASHAEIQKQVVLMKDALEMVKEQLVNVL